MSENNNRYPETAASFVAAMAMIGGVLGALGIVGIDYALNDQVNSLRFDSELGGGLGLIVGAAVGGYIVAKNTN